MDSEASRQETLPRLYREMERLWTRHAALSALQAEQGDIDQVGRLLLRIIGRAPIRSTDLAEMVGLSRPAISRRISRLEREGLIAASKDPEDGRATLLTVTGRGAACLERSTEDGVALLDHMTGDFTASELDILAALLLRLNDGAVRYHAGRKR